MEYTNILKTDIINNKYDVLWDDVADLVKDTGSRPVLVIVNGCAPGSADDVQLLKMLDACKLTPDQYTILRLKSDDMVAWHKLRDRLDPRIVFLIGIMPAQLGISAFFRLNEPNHFNDCVWLPTVDISVLELHKDVKLQLWNSGIKPIFHDKKFGALTAPGRSTDEVI
jgi:hypothetical protein